MRWLLIVTILVAGMAPLRGQQLAFDVASVKPNKSNDPPNSNFPLGPGDVYVPNGGFFKASNFPLLTYFFFAYKIKGNQAQYLVPQLPAWVTTDKFDIQARAEGNPGKDDMRLMMRSLLADRFKLAVHNEARQVPVLAVVLSKPGKTGPQLRQHPDEATPCPTSLPPSYNDETVAGGFPVLCNGLLGGPPSVPGRLHVGARNVTIAFFADSLSGYSGFDRPMLDRTGLSGTFDFILEWTPDLNGPLSPGADFQPDPSGPTFEEALREQLGLKLESQKGPVDVIVADHLEHPSEN